MSDVSDGYGNNYYNNDDLSGYYSRDYDTRPGYSGHSGHGYGHDTRGYKHAGYVRQNDKSINVK